ncbi:MAG: hypothetical protein D6729_17490, partial [Deltaproteobacteria bacterium]
MVRSSFLPSGPPPKPRAPRDSPPGRIVALAAALTLAGSACLPPRAADAPPGLPGLPIARRPAPLIHRQEVVRLDDTTVVLREYRAVDGAPPVLREITVDGRGTVRGAVIRPTGSAVAAGAAPSKPPLRSFGAPLPGSGRLALEAGWLILHAEGQAVRLARFPPAPARPLGQLLSPRGQLVVIPWVSRGPG